MTAAPAPVPAEPRTTLPGSPFPLGAAAGAGGTNFAVASGAADGRTQQGNNNAYCQDNEISWFDWAAADSDLLAFTRHLVAFRRSHPVFRRRRFLAGPRRPRWAGSPRRAPR